MERKYAKLQNGSDIRGIAMEGVPGEKVNLGREETFRLTRAFVLWLLEKTEKTPEALTVAVGTDSRLTADELKSAAIETLASLGVRVYDCGMASTPAMFMSTVFPAYRCDGAIMVTASHLPFNRNGFKYFGREGGLDQADISRLIDYACSDDIMRELPLASVRDLKEPVPRDLIDTYAAYLRQKIIDGVSHPRTPQTPLAGLHIVVDAGNGAGGFFATKVLEPLGADITGSLYLEPDGRFPHHAPNPENREAMAALCEAVRHAGADLGLIFDTDVDRAAAVDEQGRDISRNAIVAMAAALIAREHPGTTVVTDSITSDQLTVYLEQCLGLKHLRFRRGYRNVINKAIELNAAGTDCELAIETSGHAAYRENYFLDDGAYLAVRIVIKTAQMKLAGDRISSVLSALESPSEAVEYRLPIQTAEYAAYGDQVLTDLEAWVRTGAYAQPADETDLRVTVVEPNYEGVRLAFRRTAPALSGWCLLRKSLHEPLLPLNIEVTEGRCRDIMEILRPFLLRYDRLKQS